MNNLIELFWIKTKKIINVLKSIFTSPILNTIISIIALYIAYLALNLANETLENSNKQFEQNSKYSDRVFNIQLKSSKELGDSLISQIKGLQNITSKQLKITDQQLKISTETLSEQLYENRPKVIVSSIEIIDTNLYIEYKFSPLIKIGVKNIGKRTALKTHLRQFIIYSDFSGIRHHNYFPMTSIDIQPENSYVSTFKPKINYIQKDEFYFCFEINYYDEKLNKKFSMPYYYFYHQDRGEYTYSVCDDSTKNILQKKINKFAKSVDEPLFGIDNY